MAHIDLTFTARHDDKGPDDGMRLAELEDALRAARVSGAQDTTRLAFTVNPTRRVRALRVEVRDDDRTRDEHGRYTPAPPDGEDAPGAEDVRLGPRRVRDNPQA